MAEVFDSAIQSIGVVVKRERQRLGLSQEALAGRMVSLGLTSWRQTTVAKVESPSTARAVSVREALGLAAALGMASINTLFEDSESVSAALVDEFIRQSRTQRDRSMAELIRDAEMSGDPAMAQATREALAQLSAFVEAQQQETADKISADARKGLDALSRYDQGTLDAILRRSDGEPS